MTVSNRKTQFIYLAVVLSVTLASYGICDYYLASIGKELMLSWAKTEAVSVQEGNLLSSITKTQRFLLSSDYVKGVALVRLNNGQLSRRIEYGQLFSINPDEITDSQFKDQIVQKRLGFLHQRVYYKIPSENHFYLVFDVSSDFLKHVFLGFTSMLILVVIYLVWALQKIERSEATKRAELIKLAIEDLLQNDSPSSILEREAPGLLKWWNLKKSEIEATHNLAIANQSKIAFAELAAITAHDIKGSLRNIRELTKVVTGISDSQKQILQNSILRVSEIASSMLKKTQDIQQTEINTRKEADLAAIVKSSVWYKQNQYGATVKIEVDLNSTFLSMPLNGADLERSLHNLIDNSVEASGSNPFIRVTLKQEGHFGKIEIRDHGKGISKEGLSRIGTKGYTSGKTGGTGLGIFYAKKFVEDIGGRFDVSSKLGIGTKVTLKIPTKQIYLPSSMDFYSDSTLLILDDQDSIRNLVKENLASATTNGLNLQTFRTTHELESWVARQLGDSFFLFSDYYLEGEVETGLDVIERLNLCKQSIIFTSAYDTPSIHNQTADIKVPVVSKDQFFDLVLPTLCTNRNSQKKEEVFC